MKTKTPQPECPECDKLTKVAPESQKIGEFIDWLQNEKKIHLAHWQEGDREELAYAHESIEKLLAEFFKIDLDKVEKERTALLKWIQKENN